MKTPQSRTEFVELKRLYLQCCDLPSHKREDFLSQQNLSAEHILYLKNMFNVCDEETSWKYEITQQAQEAISQLEVGEYLSVYRIVRMIGRGGMGLVYEAERCDEHYTQRVAIKVLSAVDSLQHVELFHNERQYLATLNHPCIASLIDGGTCTDGSPYLVMEYVEGSSIDVYCKENNLSHSEAIELFLQVCSAVEYAHRHHIIHCDLKPSNILVTKDGWVKLIDFGISYNISGIEFNTKAFTKEYASPEQAAGKTINLVTDIFSLGKVLQELISHAPRASTFLYHADISNIIKKATDESLDVRYQSVELMKRDLRNYLTARPVTATRYRPGYVFSLFWRRYPGRTVLAISLMLSISVAVAGSIKLNIKLKQERDRAVIAEHDAESKSSSLQHTVEILSSLLTGIQPDNLKSKTISIDFLISNIVKAVDETPNIEPLAEYQVYNSLAQLCFNVGRLKDALKYYRKALNISKNKSQLPSSNYVSSTFRVVEVLRTLGHLKDAEQELENMMLSRHGELSEEQKAEANNLMGTLLLRQGLPEEGLMYLEAAEKFWAGKNNIEQMIYIGNNIAAAYYDLGRFEDAYKTHSRVLQQKQYFFGELHSSTMLSVNGVAHSLSKLGEYTRARTYFYRALSVGNSILDKDHPVLVTVIRQLAKLESELGRYKQAKSILNDALNNMDDASIMRSHLRADLGLIEASFGFWEEGQVLLEQALQELGKEYGPSSARTLLYRGTLAEIYWRSGKRELGKSMLELAELQNKQMFGEDDYGLGGIYIRRARTALYDGNWEQARLFIDKSEILLDKYFKPKHSTQIHLLLVKANLAEKQLDWKLAQKYYQELELRMEGFPPSSIWRRLLTVYSAQVKWMTTDNQLALESLKESYLKIREDLGEKMMFSADLSAVAKMLQLNSFSTSKEKR
ncbi:serine/threonine-protein kinase [Pleionea sp. CnH1-48]|uniref:serine/threonine-protein kinase n=1 Tax=Pleionea sp. CnH1-48 TaxID=2954494 RepID=UPI002097C3A0|nr:serine/threonine-protein kinase [Pleionea sp. CnH1-48]MCO7227151.1 tetratricopeptide repeat protein [Pleionea sp. CnH1-48]